MLDVEVKNFQSIESVKVKIDGFTALVGRSNIGKSALVRAIKYALTNELGTAFVRHGDMCARKLKGAKTCKCKTSVHIKTNDLDLLWEKGDGVGKYTINGVEHTAVGSGMPEFLEKAGFALLKIGSEKKSVQVSDQFSPLFLLDVSGTTVAETISDVGNLDRVNKAIKRVEKDRKEALSTRKVREKDILELDQKLLPYNNLDDVVARSNKLGAFHRTVSAAYAKVSRLEGYMMSLSQKASSYKSLLWVEKLPDLPIVGLQNSAGVFGRLGGWYAKIKTYRDQFQGLEKAQATPIPDYASLETKAKGLKTITSFILRLSDLKSAIGKFEGYETVATIEIAKPDFSQMVKVVKDSTQFEKRLTALTVRVSDLEKEYEKVVLEDKDLNAQFSELGVCPTCVQPIQSLTRSHV